MENKNDESELARKIFMNVLADTWNNDIKKLSKSLPIKIAREIKKWRIEDNYTWRNIATSFTEKYPDITNENNIISNSQLSGIMLCEASMKKLKETIDQGWN